MYEEKIIKGILCFRTSPDEDFKEYTKEELTKKLIEYKAKIEVLDKIAEQIDSVY